MTARLTFHPLGNADCTRIDLADDRKILLDYADMRNAGDQWDTRIDLPTELKADLRAAKRDYYDTVCFTHLDNDHCCGAHDFFWWDHAKKYQGEGRIKIKTLWVPAGAVLEEGCDDAARVIRQEARHRLREGYGIRVFSRPGHLKQWLEDNGLSLESRAHLIVDAGKLVPDYSINGPESVEFFVHSPFAWRINESEVIDRNNDSIVFQAIFMEGGRLTRALFMSDIDYDAIDLIVKTSKKHKNEHRLEWDIFKVPHHSSYTAIGPEKGRDETAPSEEVKWLCEMQGQGRTRAYRNLDRRGRRRHFHTGPRGVIWPIIRGGAASASRLTRMTCRPVQPRIWRRPFVIGTIQPSIYERSVMIKRRGKPCCLPGSKCSDPKNWLIRSASLNLLQSCSCQRTRAPAYSRRATTFPIRRTRIGFRKAFQRPFASTTVHGRKPNSPIPRLIFCGALSCGCPRPRAVNCMILLSRLIRFSCKAETHCCFQPLRLPMP